MSRGSSTGKVRQWTQRLERFEKAQQTVKQFCGDEGVSQPSFYQWKKRLREQASHCGQLPAGFEPVRVVPAVAAQLPQGSSRQESIVYLGRGIRIELGGDLRIVESVVGQLIAASGQADSTERQSC